MSLIFGIDADTKSIAIFEATEHRYWHLQAKARTAEERRSFLLGLFIHELFTLPLGWYIIERPVFTHNVKATIDQAYIVGGIVALLINKGYPYLLVDNTIWKKAIIGSGKASKEDIANVAETLYPKAFSFAGPVAQDIYDASLIARWGAEHLKEKP